MDTENLQHSIAALIKDLSYSSESDYPLELLRWGHKSHQSLHAAIKESDPATIPVEIDGKAFFERYIQIQENSGDPVMVESAAIYKKLQLLLVEHAAGFTVWRNGNTRVHIFMVITAPDGQLLIIKTIAIET
jgi:hypothetical protein